MNDQDIMQALQRAKDAGEIEALPASVRPVEPRKIIVPRRCLPRPAAAKVRNRGVSIWLPVGEMAR